MTVASLLLVSAVTVSANNEFASGLLYAASKLPLPHETQVKLENTAILVQLTNCHQNDVIEAVTGKPVPKEYDMKIGNLNLCKYDYYK